MHGSVEGLVRRIVWPGVYLISVNHRLRNNAPREVPSLISGAPNEILSSEVKPPIVGASIDFLYEYPDKITWDHKLRALHGAYDDILGAMHQPYNPLTIFYMGNEVLDRNIN